MKRPLQVGITGGIGSGKSLICRIFASLGVPIYDADSRAKNLMTTDGILVEQIQKEFGNLSYYPNGTLNRKYLADLTFSDQQKLEALNRLVHPRVEMDYAGWLTEQTSQLYVVKEAALLFEAGTYSFLDAVVVVAAPEDVRVKRVLMRDPHRTEKMIRDIMKNQMPETEKIKRADYLIYNDETQLVIPQVLELHRRFIS